MNDDVKDNEKDVPITIDIVAQTAISLIPYVGSPIAAAYASVKNEKRFKRVETFYQELYSDVEAMKDKIKPFEEHDEEALVAIIEKLNDKVEQEHVQDKRDYFKKFFTNTLLDPMQKMNYDERTFFLETLSTMSILECEVLKLVSGQNDFTQVGSINKPGTQQYAIVGAINRLKSYGFLMTGQGSMTIGGGSDNSLTELVKVSDFGKSFISFSLQ